SQPGCSSGQKVETDNAHEPEPHRPKKRLERVRDRMRHRVWVGTRLDSHLLTRPLELANELIRLADPRAHCLGPSRRCRLAGPIALADASLARIARELDALLDEV